MLIALLGIVCLVVGILILVGVIAGGTVAGVLLLVVGAILLAVGSGALDRFR